LGQRKRGWVSGCVDIFCPNFATCAPTKMHWACALGRGLGAGGDAWGGLVVVKGSGDGFDGVDQAGARTGYVGVAIDGPQRGVGKMMSDGLSLGHCGIQVKTARRNQHHIGIAGLSLGPRNGG
jgi:hypothetical protein